MGVFVVAGLFNLTRDRYWLVRDPARRSVTRLLLLNGIAILGGLLLLLQGVR